MSTEIENLVDDLFPEEDELLREYYNPTAPSVVIQHEKPAHRAMAMMKAQGATNKEVAEIMNYTPCGVSLITRQPWFRERVLALQHSLGIHEVRKKLQKYSNDAVEVLGDALTDDKIKPAERQRCAMYVLDQTLGKAKQSVEHVDERTPAPKQAAQMKTELDTLRAEIAAVEAGRLSGVKRESDTSIESERSILTGSPGGGVSEESGLSKAPEGESDIILPTASGSG